MGKKSGDGGTGGGGVYVCILRLLVAHPFPGVGDGAGMRGSMDMRHETWDMRGDCGK